MHAFPCVKKQHNVDQSSPIVLLKPEELQRIMKNTDSCSYIVVSYRQFDLWPCSWTNIHDATKDLYIVGGNGHLLYTVSSIVTSRRLRALTDSAYTCVDAGAVRRMLLVALVRFADTQVRLGRVAGLVGQCVGSAVRTEREVGLEAQVTEAKFMFRVRIDASVGCLLAGPLSRVEAVQVHL